MGNCMCCADSDASRKELLLSTVQIKTVRINTKTEAAPGNMTKVPNLYQS